MAGAFSQISMVFFCIDISEGNSEVKYLFKKMPFSIALIRANQLTFVS